MIGESDSGRSSPSATSAPLSGPASRSIPLGVGSSPLSSRPPPPSRPRWSSSMRRTRREKKQQRRRRRESPSSPRRRFEAWRRRDEEGDGDGDGGSPDLPARSRRRRRPGLELTALGLALLGSVFVQDLAGPTGRALRETRRLVCEVFFNPEPLNDNQREYPVIRETTLAFAVPIVTCPEDPDRPGVDSVHEPGSAFFDAAAILRHSFCEDCAELNFAAKYNHTAYAILHPDARYCDDFSGNGTTYDRAHTLQNLGYIVEIKGHPVGVEGISSPHIAEYVEADVGVRDLMRLHALTLAQHDVVVLVDFDTLVLQPLDDAIDALMDDPDATASFAFDYPRSDQITGLNRGANAGLFLFKPSFELFNDLVDLYETSVYDPQLGWDIRGVVDFDGALGFSGLVTHYYQDHPFIELNKCEYSNQALDPTNADGACRDASDSSAGAGCQDCRTHLFQNIRAGRYSENGCGHPWACHWDEAWDAPTKTRCREYHKTWFERRIRWEDEFWIGGIPAVRNGTFHFDTFFGYCSEAGPGGYEHMLFK